jgi:hypothetical protein
MLNQMTKFLFHILAPVPVLHQTFQFLLPYTIQPWYCEYKLYKNAYTNKYS